MKIKFSGYTTYVLILLQDDESDHHLDFIIALANLRAETYRIPNVVDRVKAKCIAGKIIPKVVPSAALAPGLVCLEAYKVVDGHHKLADYRNTFSNLALPLFTTCEPHPPKVFHQHTMDEMDMELCLTMWEKWVITGPQQSKTLNTFIQNRVHCMCH